MVDTLTEETFEVQVRNCGVPVVVDFYADWCEPCRELAPIVEEMSRRWGQRVRFARINVDDARRIADSFQVSSIPAMVLFDRGRPVARSIGVKPAARLEKELGLGELAGR
jgi:thioredoxin 1